MNGDFYIHMMGLSESHQGTRTFCPILSLES